jgi:uncharacterized protein (DUF3820 family)
MIMTFGKYNGQPLEHIPKPYLRWLLESSELLNEAIREVLDDSISLALSKDGEMEWSKPATFLFQKTPKPKQKQKGGK